MALPLLPRIGLPSAVVLVLCSSIAALLPDLDHPRSLAGRCIPRLLWPWVVDGEVYWLDKPRWSSHFQRWGHWRPGGVVWHRGEVHSVGVGILITLLVAGAALAMTVSPTSLNRAPATLLAPVTLLGWLSHLAADLLNPSPIMVGWPFSRRLWRPHWLPALPEQSRRGQLLEGLTSLGCIALMTLEASHVWVL